MNNDDNKFTSQQDPTQNADSENKTPVENILKAALNLALKITSNKKTLFRMKQTLIVNQLKVNQHNSSILTTVRSLMSLCLIQILKKLGTIKM